MCGRRSRRQRAWPCQSFPFLESRAAAAAREWTALATGLYAASETDQPDPAGWERIGTAAAAVLAAEDRLWTELSA